MENKIPLPTDSLYKFVALFSMTILIGAFYLTFYAGESSNAVVYENWSELASLQSLEKPNAEQAARKEMLERKIEIAVENRKTLVKLAAFLAGVGTLGSTLALRSGYASNRKSLIKSLRTSLSFLGFSYWRCAMNSRVKV
ncbi:hypothetical protein [Pseudomonas aeruginosa]|uniref:hypothetical protein n=1 Tax=Pseudomonas aeruginosa TaxID=287 RepID=UPI000E03261A|nr:hypothetical protein [Pseudomonas aeruginosa]SUC62927.1 Uncharacterised protein [Pseudomonas aeruginosa]